MVCILMWVAQEGFRDEELFIPKSIFEQKGYSVEVVSHKNGVAWSKFGKKIEVKGIEEIKLEEYDAFLLVGGPGTINLIEDGTLHRYLNESEKMAKLLGGICYAPNIMAKSGIIKGKKATVWGDPDIFEKENVIFEDRDVVIDGRVITANGPDAANEWANRIIEYLESNIKKH